MFTKQRWENAPSSFILSRISQHFVDSCLYCIPRAEWCEGLDLPEWKCVNWNAVFEASSDYCYWIVKLSSRTHQQKLKLEEDILCEKDLEVIHFVKSIQDWMHRCIQLTSFTYFPHLLSLTCLNLSNYFSQNSQKNLLSNVQKIFSKFWRPSLGSQRVRSIMKI